MATELMCPHCGFRYDPNGVPWHLHCSVERLVPEHFLDGGPGRCPGSWQNPRNPESDRRPLWRDECPHKSGPTGS